MNLDRYSSQKQRLDKLLSLSKRIDSKITSKQYREMNVLKSAFAISECKMSLQSIFKTIRYIEELSMTDSATDSDLARLFILKERVLDYEYIAKSKN